MTENRERNEQGEPEWRKKEERKEEENSRVNTEAEDLRGTKKRVRGGLEEEEEIKQK